MLVNMIIDRRVAYYPIVKDRRISTKDNKKAYHVEIVDSSVLSDKERLFFINHYLINSKQLELVEDS